MSGRGRGSKGGRGKGKRKRGGRGGSRRQFVTSVEEMEQRNARIEEEQGRRRRYATIFFEEAFTLIFNF